MKAARRIYKVKAQTTVLTKARRTKLPEPTFRSSGPKASSRTQRLQFSISCPQVGALIEPRTALSFRSYSSAAPLLKRSSSHQEVPCRGYASCSAGCPCPFPCGPCGCKGGCGCLPPPCNTPPKCLQYMTGYYYYPYGTWFCGPYHVSGTCTPVGAGCPCPCPVKCCPACVCAPPRNLSTNKNVSDINQFPMEVPCRTMPNVPLETRSGISKIFNFNGPADGKDTNQKQKQKPSNMPPCLSTLLCPYPQECSNNLMDRENRIRSSYPTHDRPKPRSYHTKTSSKPAGSSSQPPVLARQKNWKYSYYQTRHKLVTPMERARLILKGNKNSPRAKIDSMNNSSIPHQKRRDPRPEVDTEMKPYDDGRMN